MKKYRRWFLKRMFRLWRAVMQWQTHDGNVLAAATAYYAVLSLMPLLLILVSILGFIFQFSPEAQSAQEELLGIVAERTSPRIAEWLDGILRGVRERAGVGGPLGFVTLLLAAIGIFAQFEKAFDTIWDVQAPESQGILGAIRNALWQRFRAFVMFAVLGVAVVTVAVAGIGLTTTRSWVENVPIASTVWALVQMSIGVVLDWGLFTLLYKLAPKRPVRWLDAARGALLTSILWEVARHALTIGLRTSRYGAYGVIGAVTIFMLWIYAGAAIVFLGAEYVHVLGGERKA